MNNKYSNHKIVWKPEKLTSILEGRVTAPVYVRVKPTNICNHHCFWCIYNASFEASMHEQMIYRDTMSREKMMELLDDFDDIGVKAITYSGGGEPLIYAHIEEAMQKTLDYNIDLSIISNGQYLKDKKAELLTHAKWVRVSIDYCDGEGFKVSGRGSIKKFDEIIINLKNFARMKRSGELSINFIITKLNYKGLRDAAQLLKSLGVENIRFSPVYIGELEDYHNEIKEEVIEELSYIKDNYEDENFKIYSSYNLHAVSDAANHRTYDKCPFMQIVPVVGADLKVYNCHNQAYSKDGIIGSMENQTFKELWFSEETSKYFQTFNPKISCEGIQCAADDKNIIMNNMLEASHDNFI